MSQLDATTDSDGSSHADIIPSKFPSDDLDISGASTVVTWTECDLHGGTERRVCRSVTDLSLQLHRDAAAKSAFLQCKASIAFKARRDRTNVFISVQPETIRRIEIVDDDDGIQLATSKMATSTHCMRLELSKPPTLTVPKVDLTPKNKQSGLMLDSLQALAKQTSLCVHVPCTTISKARLTSFCLALSTPGLRSSPKFLDVASLYGGKGGRIIDYDPSKVVVSSSAAEPEGLSPPSYDELGYSDPPRPSFTQSKAYHFLCPFRHTDGYAQSLETNDAAPAPSLILKQPADLASPGP